MVMWQQTVNYGIRANFNLVQSDNLLSDSLILRHSEFAWLRGVSSPSCRSVRLKDSFLPSAFGSSVQHSVTCFDVAPYTLFDSSTKYCQNNFALAALEFRSSLCTQCAVLQSRLTGSNTEEINLPQLSLFYLPEIKR